MNSKLVHAVEGEVRYAMSPPLLEVVGQERGRAKPAIRKRYEGDGTAMAVN